jgi:hypothetical protein
LGEGPNDRKAWIEIRLQELADIFAVSVGGFSILDNHLHLLIRLDPEVALGWSDEEVVRRWARLFPPRDRSRRLVGVSEQWIQERLSDAGWVAMARERLKSLSWFMKCLKEPLSRLANRQDQTRGAFFEGRFKSVGILDEESLLAVSAYIDLNPVAAGIVKVPEASPYTSIKTRVDQAKADSRLPDLSAATAGSVAGSVASAGLEESIWLCPIEDRRMLDSSREGMFEGISDELASIFERLGSNAAAWRARLESLKEGRRLGRFVAASRAKLREVATQVGMHRLANFGSCPAR